MKLAAWHSRPLLKPRRNESEKEARPDTHPNPNPNPNNMQTKLNKTNMFVRIATVLAAMAGTSRPAHQIEAKPNRAIEISPPIPEVPLNLERRQLHINDINWKWRNQRQDRKARRRRWAAGDRHAFAR